MAIDVTPRLEAEEKARRYAEEVRTLVGRLVQAQEAERRRVADELHDLIGQNLTALGIDLQALKQRLQSAGDQIAAPRLDAMAALVETTIDAIRGVMTDLRPVALEEFGLVPALRWYASQFSKRTGIKVATRAPRRELRLPPDTELALFRIVQEALTNAAKHSGGTSVEIRIRYGEQVELTVQDDGCGFSEAGGGARARRGGFGLATMRERAEAHGGGSAWIPRPRHAHSRRIATAGGNPGAAMSIDVLLLDDHAVVRDGLQALLASQPDIRIVGSFGDAGRAVSFAAEAPPTWRCSTSRCRGSTGSRRRGASTTCAPARIS